ncbi:hypothetical protein DFH28DRAFT_885782 [Melampsora americana]|nr:hypothetical protein DFH28DRAFT_885782 [Melampsora americana]
MNPVSTFSFPVPPTPLTLAPLNIKSSPTSPISPDTALESVPNSPTFSTTSTIVNHKSGSEVDGVTGMIRRKISSNLLRPLHGNNSSDWTTSLSPPTRTGNNTNPTSTTLNKTQNDKRRRLGIPRLVTAPLTRLFHLNGEIEENEDGWDFICCGELPVRTERRESGWLGTLDFERPETPCATTKPITPITGSPEMVGTLDIPWCPKHNWSEAWDEAAANLQSGVKLPPLTSSGWSPTSAEVSSASPNSSQTFEDLDSASPEVSQISTETISSIYSTPPPKSLSKDLSISKTDTSPTRQFKISRDTISAPMIKDLSRTRNLSHI